jgi:hypothetical protein
MDPNQVTQVFQRCPGCRAIVSPSDASCPSCGRSLADAIDRTMPLPRLDPDPPPIASPDVTMQLPTAAPRPRVAPVPPPEEPGPGPRVVYAVPPRPTRRRRGFPVVGLLLAALLIGLAILVYLAATQGAGRGVGLPSFVQPAGAPAPAAQAPPNGWVVANTGGEGVFLRRTPRLDDRLIAWPDGTPLQDQGEEATGEGLTWRKVRDPGGNVGYVPTKWLAPKP